MGFSTDGPLVRISKGVGYVTAILTLLFGISRVWDAASGYYARKAQVRQLLAESEVQRSGSDYRAAWDTLGKAVAIGSTPAVVHAQEDLAMEWLRKIRVSDGQTFTSIVNQVAPVLTHGVIQSSGIRKADLLAHLGWADYLRIRDNQRELHPDSYFDDALKTDPSNPYAHAFKGFWMMWNHDPIKDATAQFRSAVDSNRERATVREIQLAALFNSAGLEESDELLRVCSEMIRNSETIPSFYPDRVFTWVYWSSRQDAEIRERYLKVLDIQDHLKMYQTLYGASFGANSVSRELVREFWLATLLERAGKKSEALDTYRQLKARFDEESNKNSPLRENYIKTTTEDAIRRLSAGH